MTILKRGNITYYIKDESIIVEYNTQYISYNVYALQNRKRFKDFKAEILESAPHQFDTITNLMSLSSKYALKGMVGRKPVIDELDNYA